MCGAIGSSNEYVLISPNSNCRFDSNLSKLTSSLAVSPFFLSMPAAIGFIPMTFL